MKKYKTFISTINNLDTEHPHTDIFITMNKDGALIVRRFAVRIPHSCSQSEMSDALKKLVTKIESIDDNSFL